MYKACGEDSKWLPKTDKQWCVHKDLLKINKTVS